MSILRFLIDEDSPKNIAVYLQSKGYDAIHVYEAGYSGKTDAEIFRLAQEQSRIIVSRDKGWLNLKK